jgi:hypothetical protein
MIDTVLKYHRLYGRHFKGEGTLCQRDRIIDVKYGTLVIQFGHSLIEEDKRKRLK